MAHGILAAVAFAIVFPAGAVALRVLPGRLGFWAHVLAQMVAWVLFVVAAVLGFVLVGEVRLPFGGGGGGAFLVSVFCFSSLFLLPLRLSPG